jgi:aspartate aminotransferase
VSGAFQPETRRAAERLGRNQSSLTIAVSAVARKMIADGENVISLSRGGTEFDTSRDGAKII